MACLVSYLNRMQCRMLSVCLSGIWGWMLRITPGCTLTRSCNSFRACVCVCVCVCVCSVARALQEALLSALSLSLSLLSLLIVLYSLYSLISAVEQDKSLIDLFSYPSNTNLACFNVRSVSQRHRISCRLVSSIFRSRFKHWNMFVRKQWQEILNIID